MTQLESITAEALKLPVGDRVILPHRVWNSVDEETSECEVSAETPAEFDRRWAEIEAGAGVCIPADEAMRTAREALANAG